MREEAPSSESKPAKVTDIASRRLKVVKEFHQLNLLLSHENYEAFNEVAAASGKEFFAFTGWLVATMILIVRHLVAGRRIIIVEPDGVTCVSEIMRPDTPEEPEEP